MLSGLSLYSHSVRLSPTGQGMGFGRRNAKTHGFSVVRIPVGWFVFIRDEMMNNVDDAMWLELRLVHAGYSILLLF
jgi:hypothetical protein